MSPRKSATDLTLTHRRKSTSGQPVKGALVWHHTEFGRRSACERFRIVFRSAGWQLLDADWNPLSEPTGLIESSMQVAERLAKSSPPRPRQ